MTLLQEQDPMEIERKFLVTNDSFIDESFKKSRILQGYLCSDGDRVVVRVRINGDEGFLTIKGPQNGISRYEFEQSISLKDAEDLMKLCLLGQIDKVRYCVKVGNHTWEVDVFHGENEGLVVAEIELESEGEAFALPDWVGKEVSKDKRYGNAFLSKHPYSSWGKE